MLSQRIFFITERINDILKHGIQLYKDDVKQGILKLQQELSRIHEYLRYVEAQEEEPLEQKFIMEISAIADCSDNILDGLTIYDHIWRTQMTKLSLNSLFMNPIIIAVCDVDNLIRRIENFYQAVLREPRYIFNTGSNINTGGQQSTGSISVSIGPNKPPKIRRVSRPNSYGHVPNCDIVGFNKEIETLRNHLIRHDQAQVVGIVGMGGSGKTTLAKHVYKHPDIQRHFPYKVWVCISQSWNKRDILYEILRQTKGATGGIEASKNMSDGEISENLFGFLSSQLYLVILDDLWSMDAWNEISPAIAKSKGSKVIVTTRNKVVPQLIDPVVRVLEPKQLNNEESYELLCKRTFSDDKNPRNKLQDLEIKMVLERCEGLPLAITALAGVLRANENRTQWMRMSKTLTQNILNMEDSSTQGVVKEVLAWSYHDLPHNLKPCFLYLSIFPEDHEIQAESLIKMWIAECLITYDSWSEEKKILVAEDYLEIMIQRYIVQDVERDCMGQVKAFRIHDLIRELCVENAKEKRFLEDSHRLVGSCTEYTDDWKNTTTLQRKFNESVKSLLGSDKSSHARSLILFYQVLHWAYMMLDVQPMFEKFWLLRVLVFRNIYIHEKVLEEIGNLIHLRYLEMRSCYISKLPESIGNLQNLWTLDIREVFWDGEPPMNLWKLKDLRHLYFSFDEAYSWNEVKLDKLKNLKTLWNARGGEWMLSEMAGLSPTLQKLSILDIESEEQLEAVFFTPSIMSNNLQTMELNWDSFGADLRNMNNLKKCKSLKKLTLCGLIEERKSTPIVFPPNLIKLVILFAKLEETDVMAIIGKSCPHLKILTLGDDAYMGTELVCYANTFRQLEELMLDRLENLKLWTIESGAMLNLKRLKITGCRNLDLTECQTFISKLQHVVIV